MEQILFDREQAALALTMSVNQFDNERKAGRIFTGYIGRKPVFHIQELLRYAAQVALPSSSKVNDESLSLSA